ncbi:hypothetical protein NLJ89_g9911 [Agrocybe chaxingu]|uniref:FAD-binding PCMH-type domain-containing protein n=1 Tax=Agrocybe chaxingu TaxID=84603 RepID=A0A9W8MPF1_9AGAR|nr:hypothetical protein NLJ89_g9911 [Agrocybe chaxingu]
MSAAFASKLPRTFKGDFITPDHPEYAQAISRWAVNAARKARAVAFVKDNQDVVHILKLAKDNNLAVAVRGGGHHAFGASSVEDGLVIDLSRYLSGVRVDPSKKLAYVGGGAVWETVDKEGIKHGLATVGGTVNHTGVGGLILGGGYGWLSAAYGLAVDNLVQATIVTADGSVLTVNSTENADLFFAIRGGGGNFGVVTEFVLQLHPQRATVYSGTLIFPTFLSEKVVSATEKWHQTATEKESVLEVATVGPDGNAVVIVIPFYNGSEAEGREHFKDLLVAGPVADISREIPYEELNSLQNPLSGHGRGVYMKGSAFKHLHPPSFIKAHQRFAEIVKGGIFNGAIIYEFFGLKKINSVAQDTTAFRRVQSHNILITLTWDPTQDRTEEAKTLVEGLSVIATEGQENLTASDRLGYSNYDPESAVGGKSKFIFGENYVRLQSIKKLYDPDNVFNKWFPIMPA